MRVSGLFFLGVVDNFFGVDVHLLGSGDVDGLVVGFTLFDGGHDGIHKFTNPIIQIVMFCCDAALMIKCVPYADQPEVRLVTERIV